MRMGSFLPKIFFYTALIFLAFPAATRAFPEFEFLQQGGYSQLPPSDKIHLGRVRIQPGLAFETRFTDNVFLTADKTFANGSSEGRNEDLIFSIKPSLLASMTRGKGEPFGFYYFYRGEDQHYVDLSASQNTLIHHTGGALNFGGPGGRTDLLVGGSYHKTNSFIGQDFRSNLGNRIGVETYIGFADFIYSPTNRFKTQIRFQLVSNRFGPDFRLPQDVDIFNITTGFLKQANEVLTYGLRYDHRINSYKNATLQNDTSVSDRGFLLVRWTPNELIESELSFGYESKSFKRFDSENRNRPIAQLDVTYTPFSRTEFTFHAMNEIGDSSFQDIQTFILSRIRLGLNQKMGRKLTLETEAQVENYDYKRESPYFAGGGAPKVRVDNIVKGTASLVYDIKDWLQIKAQYIYEENVSNFDDNDFIANTGLIQISAEY